MSKKIQQKQKSSGLPLWLGTFGDLMSLLLTFFILLLSMATFDAKKLLEAESSLRGALSILSGGIKFEPSNNRITLPADIVSPPEYAPEVNLIEQSVIDFNNMANVSKGIASIRGDGVNGFILTLPANVVFDDNFKINEDSMMFFKRVSQIVEKMPETTQIEILGRSNISSSQINIDRAANMALSIARVIHGYSINGNRISPIGKEDKTLKKTKEDELINIRFYPKDNNILNTKGLLNK